MLVLLKCSVALVCGKYLLQVSVTTLNSAWDHWISEGSCSYMKHRATGTSFAILAGMPKPQAFGPSSTMPASSVSPPEEAFEIFSSLRYDPSLPDVFSRHGSGHPDSLLSPYYLLAYHQDRLRAAAHHFQWPRALDWLQQDLRSFRQSLDASITDRSRPWRLRVVVDSNGNGTVDVYPTADIDPTNLLIPSLRTSSAASVWRVHVDTQYITPSSLTTHKTTAREDYTAARLRAGIRSPAETAEVLTVNPDGEVMEGSITTPYFLRRGTRAAGTEGDPDQSGPMWITPPLASGGNAGTTRRYALSQGFCVEQTITRAELVDGESCWLSNGVRGFMPGVVVFT